MTITYLSEPIATLLCPEKLDKLQNHCLHCHLFSKAPIPCEVRKSKVGDIIHY